MNKLIYERTINAGMQTMNESRIPFFSTLLRDRNEKTFFFKLRKKYYQSSKFIFTIHFLLHSHLDFVHLY